MASILSEKRVDGRLCLLALVVYLELRGAQE